MKRFMVLILGTIFTVLLLGSSVFAQEDEIIEAIDFAKMAYTNDEYREAVSQLNKALNKINKKIVVELKGFLPEPFGGWDADKPEGGASGLALLSELSVKRRYYKRGTGKSIDVEILSNAPKIPSIRMWLSNPRLMNAEEGLAVDEINRVRCITKYESLNRYAEIDILVGSSFLVVIRGFEARNLDDVKKFAKKIKIEELETKFP